MALCTAKSQQNLSLKKIRYLDFFPLQNYLASWSPPSRPVTKAGLRGRYLMITGPALSNLTQSPLPPNVCPALSPHSSPVSSPGVHTGRCMLNIDFTGVGDPSPLWYESPNPARSCSPRWCVCCDLALGAGMGPVTSSRARAQRWLWRATTRAK